MPLRDFRCGTCGQVQERFYHATAEAALLCDRCQSPALEKLDLSAGSARKTAIFPYQVDFGDGTKRTVDSLGHLRQLEKTFGVVSTAFSQEPSNPESPSELPRYRPNGRTYEGLDFPKHVREQRERGVREAARAIETGRYRR